MKVRVRPRILNAQRKLRESRDRCQDAGNRRGRSYAFTSLTPIKPGGAAAVDLELRRYESGPSPFRNLPEVHAARLVVIDQLKTGWFGVPEPRPQLRSQYVLFTADVIAPYDGYAMPDQFLKRMYVSLRAEVHAVWGQCYGFATARDPLQFAAWLKKSQLDTSLYFVGYPDTTPDEVSEALRVRDELIEFVRTHQYLHHWARIRHEYLTHGAAWFPSS
jgi:hypothetical protein